MENIGNEVIEEAVEQPTQEEQPASFSRLRDKLKSRNPEKEYTDDAAYEDEIMAYYDDTDSQLAKSKETNEKIMSLIASNPEMAAVVEDVSRGMPFSVALARHIDPSDLVPEEGEPDYEQYSQMSQERIKRKADYDNMLSEIESNRNNSGNEVLSFFEEEGMDDDQRTEYLAWVDGIFDGLQMGKIDKKTLKILLKAKNYDTAVEEAREAGEIQGRNKKIENGRSRKSKVDGLPSTGGGVSSVSENPSQGGSLIGRVGNRIDQRTKKFQ